MLTNLVLFFHYLPLLFALQTNLDPPFPGEWGSNMKTTVVKMLMMEKLMLLLMEKLMLMMVMISQVQINPATKRWQTKILFRQKVILHSWHIYFSFNYFPNAEDANHFCIQEREDVQGFCETESCCDYDFVISGLCPSYPANVKVCNNLKSRDWLITKIPKWEKNFCSFFSTNKWQAGEGGCVLL